MEHRHGTADEPSDTPEEERSPAERALLQTMRETNKPLTAREHRLAAEWDEAELRNDVDGMAHLDGLISETRGLRFNISTQSELESSHEVHDCSP